MRRLNWIAACVLISVTAWASAQVAGVDYSGTYRLVGPEGTLTVTLRQSGTAVTGSMADDSGASMTIEGSVGAGAFSGIATFGQARIPVTGVLRGPDRLSWTIEIEPGFGQEFVLDRLRAVAPPSGPGPAPGPGAQNPLANRAPNPLATASPWVGAFRTADGSLSVTLRQDGEGFAGSLVIRDPAGALSEYPVALRAAGDGLAGTFGAAPQTFPLSLQLDTAGGLLTLTSGEFVHTLERQGAAGDRTYRHAKGWYTMSLPAGWRALSDDPLATLLDAGRPGAFIAVLASHLDPEEVGQRAEVLFQNGLTEIEALLAEDFGIRSDSTGARAAALASTQHPAAEASWDGAIGSGPGAQPVRIWAGMALDREFLVLVLAVLNPEHLAEMTPQIRGVLASTRILAAPSAAELERLAQSGESEAQDPLAGTGTGGAPVFTRRVTFNGTRLDDATIGVLERGMGITIPDYDYWYDPGCGAIGGVRGPAVGFFPPGLRLGGPLRADASGGGSGMLTGVFVNGRELHPQDLMGLASITGPVAPGRYWLDGSANFGIEGGGVAGNLLLLARARQVQGGGGGAGGGGGGGEAWTRYKDFGGGEGGTHFGSFGGGDFYFSGGGVDWWPGK
jgi:hypothetical protein